MKKEKTVEYLLKNYRNNKAEIKMLSYGLDLQAVQYNRDAVQTSNKSDLSDIVIKREKILNELKQDVHDTECLLDSLEDKERFIIEGFYIRGLKQVDIASELNLNTEDAVWKRKNNILKNLRSFYERIRRYREVC